MSEASTEGTAVPTPRTAPAFFERDEAEDGKGGGDPEGGPQPGRSRHRRLVPKRATWPYLLLGLVFLVGYSVIEISRYAHYQSMSWDTAIFVQEVRAYAHFHAPIVHIKGAGYNILGDHFSPILILLAPFYRIFPSAVTLLLAQALLMASSVTIVSATAARLLTRRKGLALGFAYGLSWGMQRAVDFDFHEIAFAVPLLAMVLRSMLLGRWHRAAFWALPLVLVKEDMGLTVAAIGLLFLLSRQWQLGGLLVLFGIGMLLLTVEGVIPHFAAGHAYAYYSKLPGGSLGKMPLGSTLTHILSPAHTKLPTLGYLFGITGFLALRSRLALLVVPTLGWRFVSDNPDYWGTAWHYSAVLMPILFLAVVDAMVRSERGRVGWLRTYAREGAVPVVTAVALALCATMTLPAIRVFQPVTYKDDAHTELLNRALNGIPDGATVEANVTALAHLATRTDVYWIGGDKTPPQYLALDLSYGWSPSAPTDLPGYAAGLHPGATYSVVFDQDGFAILKLNS